MRSSPTKRLTVLVVVLGAALGGWLASRNPEAPRAGPGPAAVLAGEPAEASLAPVPEELERVALGDARVAAEAPLHPPAAASEPKEGTAYRRLHGSVTDTNGEPIADVSIELRDDLGERTWTRSKSDGQYSLPAPGPGRAWLSVVPRIHCNLRATVDFPDPPCAVRKDIVLERKLGVGIRVVDLEGQPFVLALDRARFPQIHPLSVLATRAPPKPLGGGDEARVGTLRVERIQAHPEWLGVLELRAAPPLFVSIVFEHLVLETRRLEAPVEELTFAVDPARIARSLGSVRWQIVDAATGDTLTAYQAHLLSVPRRMPAAPSAESQGWVQFDDLPPGRHEIVAFLPGYERFRLDVLVEPGWRLDLGTIPVEPETWIRGSLLDPEHRAAQVSCSRLDPLDPFAPFSEIQTQECRKDGSFEFRGLGRGDYVVRSAGRAVAAIHGPELASRPQWVSTKRGPVEDVLLQLEETLPLVLLVTDPACESWGFRIHDDAGLVVRRGRCGNPGPLRSMLPRGSYEVRILDEAGSEVLARTVELAARPVRIEVRSD